MGKGTRVLIAVIIVIVAIGGVLGAEALRRPSLTVADLPAGAISLYMDDQLVAGLTPADLEPLPEAAFVDVEEGKTQQGWWLRDVLALNVDTTRLEDSASVVVSSSSRQKAATLSWAQIADPANNVLFDLSNRGTVKLASNMAGLDSRDAWVQDVDRIEVTR